MQLEIIQADSGSHFSWSLVDDDGVTLARSPQFDNLETAMRSARRVLAERPRLVDKTRTSAQIPFQPNPAARPGPVTSTPAVGARGDQESPLATKPEPKPLPVVEVPETSHVTVSTKADVKDKDRKDAKTDKEGDLTHHDRLRRRSH